MSDVDWDVKDGHYRVRLNDEWVDVPDSALITEPNRAGRTMVWPFWLACFRRQDDGAGVGVIIIGARSLPFAIAQTWYLARRPVAASTA